MNYRIIALMIFFVIVLAGCGNQSLNNTYYSGLIGAYYGDPDLTNIKFPEVLNSLDNEWDEQTGHGSAWSAQYEGYFISPTSGELTIFLLSNKSTILELNGKGKIETNAANQKKEITFDAVEGEKYPVNLKFNYTAEDPGNFKISWAWKGHSQEVIPSDSFVFDANQSIKWNWLPEPDPTQIDYTQFAPPSNAENKTVFYEKGKFAGWPANGGIWIWGDEIVVNFTVGFYKEMDNHHSIDGTKPSRSILARSRDGGKSFTKLGLICPNDNYRAVMPSSVKLSDDHFISALRKRYDERFGDEKPQLSHNWIDVYETLNGGKSWSFLSKVAETDMGKNNGNPPSMVKLRDGRLCITYGYRAEPYGIRAKISDDNGKTWSDEIHLPDHAREFDMGYTRSVQRTDGKIVTIYYFFNDKVKEQHIAATIWDPGFDA